MRRVLVGEGESVHIWVKGATLPFGVNKKDLSRTSLCFLSVDAATIHFDKLVLFLSKGGSPLALHATYFALLLHPPSILYVRSLATGQDYLPKADIFLQLLVTPKIYTWWFINLSSAHLTDIKW